MSKEEKSINKSKENKTEEKKEEKKEKKPTEISKENIKMRSKLTFKREKEYRRHCYIPNSSKENEICSKNNNKNKATVDTRKETYYTKEDFDKFDTKEYIKAHLVAGSKRMSYQHHHLHIILDKAKEVFEKSDTLIEVKSPVNVCGDIFGHYVELMRIFNSCGLPFKTRYLFLGNFVCRGYHSLEVIVLLLCCRIQFPRLVFLLRGNNETVYMSKVFGFYNECMQRFRAEGKQLYDHFNDVFDMMPLAAIISGRILCMHGGLSPLLTSLDDIRNIKRPLRKVRGMAQDLLFADPAEFGLKGFHVKKFDERNESRHLFGEDVVIETCKQLNIDLIIRANQVVEFGYAFFAKRSLITVFSAARYHLELVNYAAVVQVNKILEVSFVQLKPREFAKAREEIKWEQRLRADQDERG